MSGGIVFFTSSPRIKLYTVSVSACFCNQVLEHITWTGEIYRAIIQRIHILNKVFPAPAIIFISFRHDPMHPRGQTLEPML